MEVSDYNGTPIRDLSGEILTEIKDGMEVIVSHLFGDVKAKINKPLGVAETEGSYFILEFDKDDRHCWTSPGGINKKCLDKLK